ncbi:myosin-1 [Nadsonia fulvescens var. elongata DSM 6958]|uniref:Myosin-1 n=1 Tax=Nadsonia fulvescens var. elongata DSM 6958 TaxID=857566 RepID=A0A1E3PEV4_9ASCO|nr:myosin-1 [Nadsonia fulvescens var. elongata DSM 6958]
MAVTKRAGRNKAPNQPVKQQPAKRGVQKASYDITKKKEVGVTDLTLLSKVNDEEINNNLQKRFESHFIYTYIGHVLISVNPFKDLGIYTEQVLESYRGKNRLEVPPHVFAIAESMYYNLKAYDESQCVIISGESGAGKTEAAKRIMQYISSVSAGANSASIQKIKDMVLATNPLLESFGCAKTLRNNNSSRHGKYLEIQFNKQGEPIGATITNYLLEKGRVVGQIQNERNFHIFYQFTKGASEAQRQTFGIQAPESYTYTSASKCTAVNGIDDVADFKETLRAMDVIGLRQSEQDQILKLLAGILWIGNVYFVEDEHGNAAINDPSVPNFIAYLLDVDADSVISSLTTRIMETSRGGRRGSVYEVPLNVVQANAVKDALAKGIYNNLFDWIVERVNASLNSQEVANRTIGILDIYGFEIFENNSFEQLCINYVNEKLQQIFIQLTLKTEQEEYVREQIQWAPIKYFNNKVVCDLIEEKRPPGIFAALNDACATAHADPYAADQSFIQRLSNVSGNPHFEARQSKFVIKHYAGDVTYDVEGVTDKNKDLMIKDLLVLLSKSQNSFLAGLFPEPVDTGSRKRPPSASDKIRTSANDLVHTLSLSQPSYIRTIKPNQNKSPTEYDSKAVLHQVKYLGLQENVRIRRAGFAYRQTFDKFVERFYLLSPKTSYAGDFIWQGESREATLQILKDTSIPVEEYQMGVTKIFVKTPETLFALEHMRDRYWHNMAARIQRAWRNYLQYRIDMATRIQRAFRRSKGGEPALELRDKGNKLLAGRKQRRRLSMIGSRRFTGDYLACNDKSGVGNFMVKTLIITEPVIFSARAETLTSKFGRSSLRVERILILTRAKLYIIVEQVLNRQLSYHIERTIGIANIKYVGVSNLRDDWFSVVVEPSKEPDSFLWCPLKTEFVTQLREVRPSVEIRVKDVIEYKKKANKYSTVAFIIDNSVSGHFDIYKSGKVHVPSGLPANSVSAPTPKKKPGIGIKANTAGKLLKKGGGNAPQGYQLSQAASRPTNQPQQQQQQQQQHTPHQQNNAPSASRSTFSPAVSAATFALAQTRISSRPETGPTKTSSTASRPMPPIPALVSTLTPASIPAVTSAFSMVSSPAVVAQSQSRVAPQTVIPPPPPPPPAAEPKYKALYPYTANSASELPLTLGEFVSVKNKEGNGWWLVCNSLGQEGWVPATYLEEIKVVVRPSPPPPPSSNGPIASTKRKAAPTPPVKKSAISTQSTPVSSTTPTPLGGGSSNTTLGSGLADALKKKNEANQSLAGGLAQAIKMRAGKMNSDDEEDDDDDDW